MLYWMQSPCESIRIGSQRTKAMRILDPGHRFQLDSFDGDSGIQVLQFVKREGWMYPGNVGHDPGTNTQEVLRATISRAIYLNQQIPCWQTKVSIWLMGIVVWLYEHRAAKRHRRETPGLYHSVYGVTCVHCGHVGCEGECRGVPDLI